MNGQFFSRVRAAARDYVLLLSHRLFSTRVFKSLLLHHLYKERLLVIGDFSDHSLAFHPYEYIGRNLLLKGAYQRETITQAFKTARKCGLVPEHGVFLDVGANIGTHTVYADKEGAFSRFFCIEPDCRNVEVLSVNVRLNGMDDRVRVFQCAAGSEAGVLPLHRSSTNFGASTLRANGMGDARGGDAVQVQVRRLDDMMGEAGVAADDIGFVWMDVEGYELPAMKGMGDYLSKVPVMVFEYSAASFTESARQELADVVFGRFDRVLVYGRGFERIRRADFLDIRAQVDVLALSIPR